MIASICSGQFSFKAHFIRVSMERYGYRCDAIRWQVARLPNGIDKGARAPFLRNMIYVICEYRLTIYDKLGHASSGWLRLTMDKFNWVCVNSFPFKILFIGRLHYFDWNWFECANRFKSIYFNISVSIFACVWSTDST